MARGGSERAIIRTIGIAREQPASGFFIERNLMGEVGGEAFEREIGIAWREKLFVREVIVQAERIVEEIGADANALSELKVSRLIGESWSGGIGIKDADGRAGLIETGAEVDKAAVDFAVKREMEALVGWLDSADAEDSFTHSVEGAAGFGGRGAETEEGEFVERNRLSVDVDDGVFGKFRQVGIDWRWSAEPDADAVVGSMDEFQINTGAPGAVDGADGVGVPTRAPIVGGFVAEIGDTGSKTVLRGDAADGDVNGLASEKFFGAIHEFGKVEATIAQFIGFAGRIDSNVGIMRGWRRRRLRKGKLWSGEQ